MHQVPRKFTKKMIVKEIKLLRDMLEAIQNKLKQIQILEKIQSEKDAPTNLRNDPTDKNDRERLNASKEKIVLWLVLTELEEIRRAYNLSRLANRKIAFKKEPASMTDLTEMDLTNEAKYGLEIMDKIDDLRENYNNKLRIAEIEKNDR